MRGHFRKVNEEEKHLSFENVDSSSPAPPPQIHAPFCHPAHTAAAPLTPCAESVSSIYQILPPNSTSIPVHHQVIGIDSPQARDQVAAGMAKKQNMTYSRPTSTRVLMP